ncbi:hypothetical protein ACFT1B_36370, partial [Streptomyces griseoincarnatus]
PVPDDTSEPSDPGSDPAPEPGGSPDEPAPEEPPVDPAPEEPEEPTVPPVDPPDPPDVPDGPGIGTALDDLLANLGLSDLPGIDLTTTTLDEIWALLLSPFEQAADDAESATGD